MHGGPRAWGSLGLGDGACGYVGVLLGQLLIDIKHALTEGCNVIKGVGGAVIDSDMLADACSEPSFEVEACPVHVNNVFTDLGDDSLEFSMIFEDGTEALYHVLNGEMELTSIVGMDEAFLERLDEFIKGEELGGQCIFHHEPEFCGASKKGCCTFHFLLLINGCSNMHANLEDPGVNNGKGCIFSREGWRLGLFQHRDHHSGRRGPGYRCHVENRCCMGRCLGPRGSTIWC